MQNQYSTRNITNKFMKIFYIYETILYRIDNILCRIKFLQRKLQIIFLKVFYVELESMFKKENYKLYF